MTAASSPARARRRFALGAGLALALAAAPRAGAEDAVRGLDPATLTPDRITLNVEDADLREVLGLIALARKTSIVAGSNVEGKVTAALHDVPLEDALRAVLEVNGFGFRSEGGLIVVLPKAEIEKIEAAARTFDVRVLRPDYVSVAELEAVVQPLLSPEGRLTKSPAQRALVVRDTPDRLDRVVELAARVDRRPRQVLVEATILDLSLNEETALGVDFKALAGTDFQTLGGQAGGNSLSTGPAAGELLDQGLALAGTEGFAGAPGAGFTFGIVKNNLAAFLDALETIADANVLANPKILAVDQERASIIIGRRLGFRTRTTTQTATVENVEFLDVGTQLSFTPQISEDGYIRMSLHPEQSSGGLNASDLPEKSTTELTTQILVRDGETIVIGGLIEEVSERVVRQVPFLGSLPAVGWLFRRTEESRRKREIVVLITSRIVDPDRAAEEAAGERDRMLKAKVGLEESFAWYTRSRHAARHVESGRGALAAGNLRTARFHVSRAKALEPQAHEAIALGEEIERVAAAALGGGR